jgi:ADP-ribose pyrophosphatase YjhB (NUDIX family)
MSPVQAAGAIILARAGDLHVVVIRRGRPPRKGAWTIPGGRVEPGETSADAARREAREETGLDVRVLCETEVYMLEAFAIHEHLCVPREPGLPALVAGDDADEARWVTLPDLATLEVHEDARAVIARAAAILGTIAVP